MKKSGCFSVISDTYVTTDAGTGIVHQAPGFGADDYRVCLKHGLIESGKAPVPLNDDGEFVAPVTDYEGQYIKSADDKIMADLKARGRLLNKSTIVHSYPFCWRS